MYSPASAYIWAAEASQLFALTIRPRTMRSDTECFDDPFDCAFQFDEKLSGETMSAGNFVSRKKIGPGPLAHE